MSVGGSPGHGCDDVGDERKICDCLSCSLEEIARATEGIHEVLDERLGKLCDNVDECIEEIIDAINSKFGPGLSTVSECQRLLSLGLGGTLEYAIRCAGQVADECDAACSLGLPENQGKCCTLPDGTEGICRNGVCVPSPGEEPTEEKPFIGWCNPVTKVVIVTRAGQPPPGLGFVNVALAETEQVAFLQAQTFCEQQPIITQPDGAQIPQFGPSVLPFCSLGSLLSGETLNIASQAQKNFFATGGGVEAVNAFADIGALGINLTDVGSVLWGATRVLAGLPSFMGQVAADLLPPLVGCTDPAFQGGLKLRASLQMFEKQSGVSFSDFMVPYNYAMHAACRQKHLDPDKSMASYLANGIGRNELEALWAIHGVCPEDIDWYIDAARSKPLPLQLAIMRHREIISASEYHGRMREVGFTKPEVSEQLFDITRQVPPLQDIIRFMVRDAGDDAPGGVVQRFGLDTEFNTKYSDQLKEWARDQGIPDKIAKFAWRAHWTIPGAGQLFEFFKRLRNDPKFPNMTADIKAALIQQDILPFWHDAFFATSFRPMRLRDIRRSFQIGTLTEKETRFAFSQLGYSDDTVDLMFRFLERLRDNSISNHKAIKLWTELVIDRAEATKRLTDDGYPAALVATALADASIDFMSSPFGKSYVRGDMTATELSNRLTTQGLLPAEIAKITDLLALQIKTHWALDEFKTGTMDEPATRARMAQDGLPPETIDATVTDIDRGVRLSFVKACQNGIRRKFLLGELDAGAATSELVQRQTVNPRAALMVDWWGCELKNGERNVSAVTLCEWLERGAITSVDFTKRLEKIGFSSVDAALMMEDCLIKISARRLAQAKKEAKEQAAEQTRIDRILQRAARQELAAVNKARAVREKAARTRDRRLKQLHKTIDKVTDRGEVSTNDAYQFLNSEKGRIESEFALSQDQTLQTLLLASEEWGGGGGCCSRRLG